MEGRQSQAPRPKRPEFEAAIRTRCLNITHSVANSLFALISSVNPNAKTSPSLHNAMFLYNISN
jgi:hypothetical protein